MCCFPFFRSAAAASLPGDTKRHRESAKKEAAMQRQSDFDVNVSNNTKLKMAIADLFHAENIPDRVVERPRFQLVLK